MNEGRAELLELLCRDGIFRSTPEHPIVAADKSPVSWMLDSLRVSTTARGGELAARCLLAELARFESTQIATYGVTAIPLLQACVMLGGGRYTGIVVRKEKKAYGSMKLLEGTIDPTRPVVILDDSISSGSSTFKCIEVLEAAGLRVEGGVYLVRFGWQSGWATLVDRGLRAASVFDVFRDIVPHVEPTRPMPLANPSDVVPAFAWADDAAPRGIHPTALARRVIECVHAGLPIPRPPDALDGDPDAAGGCWVSVRSHANIQERHARNGFWTFPGELRRPAGEAVIRAALRTAGALTAAQLGTSAVAVTFFGALEECTPGELDNARYGILARGRERTDQIGGALPNMPSISRDWAQFEHARTRNAKLQPNEPFVLYRHDVAKVVEPGATWQPTGVPTGAPPAWHRAEVAGAIAARARVHVLAALSGEPTPPDASVPEVAGVDALYLTVFRDGRVLGCMGTKITAIDADLRKLAEAALADPRFGGTANTGPGRLVVTVSFLDEIEMLGVHEPAAVAPHVLVGVHAIMVQQNARAALLLPFVTLQHSLTPQQLITEVIDKAGITRAPYAWVRYRVRSWYADGERTCHAAWGLPPGDPPATLAAGVARLLPRLVDYLRAHRRADGSFEGLYRPFVDRVMSEVERPRQIYAAWTLAVVKRRLGGDDAIAPVAADDLEINEAAFALLGAIECGHDATALVARLAGAIDVQGFVPVLVPASEGDAATARERTRRATSMALDYTLPQVVFALATAAARGIPVDAAAIDRAMNRCARRFRVAPSWGQVCWLPQAAAAVYALAPDPELARLAFDVVDWALPYQQRATGGFINGEQLDSPGCTTAVYLEGIAAALGLARATGDRDRAARYEAAALAALGFVDGLVYQERDRALLPAPERAFGGVRLSRTAGDVRVDFVCHAIHALLHLSGSGS